MKLVQNIFFNINGYFEKSLLEISRLTYRDITDLPHFISPTGNKGNQ